MDLNQLPQEPADLLAWAMERYGDRFAIVTSLQAEENVLIDMAVRINPRVQAFTLDTGRLHQETYQALELMRERYNINIDVVAPETAEVEAMTTRFGPNLFYKDVAYRKLCCQVRKVRPLERKLSGYEAYAVGLRREQSGARANIPQAEMADGRLKLSPLVHWTRAQLYEYMDRNNVPRHPLQSPSFPSIGCAPCTRAIEPGEEERAGRWWWEQDNSRECGLHVTPNGNIKRTLDILLDEILVN